jgi:hypothetical protein
MRLPPSGGGRPAYPKETAVFTHPVAAAIAAARLSVAGLAPADVNVTPNETGLPGIAQIRDIVGAVMTIGLILSVLALIASAVVWGFGANSSNPHLASRGKLGVLVSCGAAAICGASVALVNFFWGVGQTV